MTDCTLHNSCANKLQEIKEHRKWVEESYDKCNGNCEMFAGYALKLIKELIEYLEEKEGDK